MNIPKNYRVLYDALPYKRKQLVLAAFKKWGCWSKATVYNKLAGDSVTPIEQVMMEGVFDVYVNRRDAEQLEIAFVWDASEMSLKCDPRKLVFFSVLNCSKSIKSVLNCSKLCSIVFYL